MARLAGLEPATTGLEGRCSIRLSYRRIDWLIRESGGPFGAVVGVNGFEPLTFCSQSRRATRLRHTPPPCRASGWDDNTWGYSGVGGGFGVGVYVAGFGGQVRKDELVAVEAIDAGRPHS